jgi:hypothetical protein
MQNIYFESQFRIKNNYLFVKISFIQELIQR